MPLFRTNAPNRLTQTFNQLNSLFNPLLYCYRDHRFRNALRELLGIKKPQLTIQSVAGAAQFLRQKDPVSSLELHFSGKRIQRLKRSLSCNLNGALDSVHGTPSVITLKRSLSAPTLEIPAATP